jgi:hypothetical protein
MQSSSKQPAILRRIASQRAIPGLALVAGLCIFGPAQHAAATWLGHGAAALIEISNDTLVTEVATRGGRAGGARVARAGGVRAGRGVAVRGGARGVAYRGGVYRRGVGVGAAAAGAAAVGAAATASYYSGYGPGYDYGPGYSTAYQQPGYGSWTGYQQPGYGYQQPGYGSWTGYQQPGSGSSTGYQQPGTGSSTQSLTFEQAWAKCTPEAQQVPDWNVQGRTARGKSCMLRYGYRI